MMMTVEKFDAHNCEVEIVSDDFAENPREIWDNFGTVFTRGFIEECESDWPDEKENLVLPVYRFEHSGVAYQTTPFSCPWDSGLTGFIYVPKDKVREEFGVKRITKKIRDRVLNILKTEIQYLSAYANGDVFGYRVFDQNENEVDSCYGFYGYLELDWDHMIEMATNAAKYAKIAA